MGDFDLYVAGVPDPLLIRDGRFETADDVREYLEDHATRPVWLSLGGVTLFSQNVKAVQETDDEE